MYFQIIFQLYINTKSAFFVFIFFLNFVATNLYKPEIFFKSGDFEYWTSEMQNWKCLFSFSID